MRSAADTVFGKTRLTLTVIKRSAAVTSNAVLWKPRHDETAVVDLACEGDVDAFATLYGKYRDRIHNVCLSMIKDPFLAEDMLQQTFLCAFRRIRSFRRESLFSTWLHRIAVNVVLMHFRRCKTSPIENANAEGPYPDDDPLEAECFHVEDRHLTHAMDRMALEKAINSLPPGYRTIFVLHDIEGFEHTEIASMLGCTPGNTKSQLFKARKKLRTLLTPVEVESDSRMHERIAA
jgi:RNA polymerase sigma-70 factor (ECF subfamily)